MQCLARLGLVEVLAADRRVGKHRHDFGLDLEDTAGYEDQFLGAPAFRLDSHGAGLDARDQRGVPGINPQLTRFARQGDELGLAGVDLLFGADDVDVDGECHYCRVFAFSTASSMAPTM